MLMNDEIAGRNSTNGMRIECMPIDESACLMNRTAGTIIKTGIVNPETRVSYPRLT